VPAALPTRLELREQLIHARTELIVAEDVGDPIGAELARARCDSLLDRMLTLGHKEAS
jgi:hypothetical protein